MIQSFHQYLLDQGFYKGMSSVQIGNGRQVFFFDEEGFLHQLFLAGDDQTGTLYYSFSQIHLISFSMTLPKDFILKMLKETIDQTGTKYFRVSEGAA